MTTTVPTTVTWISHANEDNNANNPNQISPKQGENIGEFITSIA